MKKQGFTLVELLVVITIVAILVGITLTNLAGARSRARDAQLKSTLFQIKNALRLYYNDYQSYPADTGGPMYFDIYGCGAAGNQICNATGPCGDGLFAAGGSGCDNIYMSNLPDSFNSTGTNSISYRTSSNADNFCLETQLEVDSDPDIADSQARCAQACTSCSGTDYCVCAE